VQPLAVCDYNLIVERLGELNAYADGETVFVSQRMMEFSRSDNELAVVVGHEFAHNALGHVDSQQDNRRAGAIVGLILDMAAIAAGASTGGEFAKLGGDIGSDVFSQEFEAEADYVGLYATARAGYDIDVGADFWRRMAAENPDAITYASSHPTTIYRAAALDQVVMEISDKKRVGLPMEPEFLP
jgi:predicted Zn-dependent protease